MTKAEATLIASAFLQPSILRRSTMPSGVYDRSVKLTAEQKKELNAARTRQWTAKNRERAKMPEDWNASLEQPLLFV